MRAKDWEYHAALLHKHDSAKFNVPTKRVRESPVVEQYGTATSALDLVILVGCASALGVIVLLLIVGLL
jgi:hypothetical protein